MTSKNIKLKDVLSLVKNKRNSQYSFTLKKRAMFNLGMTPKNILDISVNSNGKIIRHMPTKKHIFKFKHISKT